jgi:hypothetical protein
MKRIFAILGTGIGCLLLVSTIVLPVSAQESTTSSSNANSMKIAPVRTELALDPGASKDITVYAQNLTQQTVQARVLISDFEASKDESGKPLIILDDKYAESHSLKRLATATPNLVSLPPGERVPVKVTITAPVNAMAGGYYGAVRFLPADELEPGGNGVSLSTNIGSLVILKINGELKEKMTLESMDVRQEDKPGTFFNSPKGLKVVVRFNNQGNIQEQPFGKLQILDRSGKIVEEHTVNNTDPRGNVLPDSIRRFDVDLKKVGSFGKYTLQGNFGYGTKGELLTYKSTFWVVPTTYIIGGIAGLLFLGGIIFLIVRVITLSRRGGSRGRRY